MTLRRPLYADHPDRERRLLYLHDLEDFEMW
jgi:hypothetical protein